MYHNHSNRAKLTSSKRWVVKVGSALLTDAVAGLNRAFMDHLVAQIAALRERGIEVVLVSSGSIVEGMQRLGWSRKPKHIHQLQSAAAVGQMGLVQHYESEFQKFGLHTAQILLTHADLANRMRYLNARGTITALLGLNVIPVINENDTVVTDEIRFGDNDTLGALVANLVEAEVLILLTDQDGLCDKDPREHRDATLIKEGVAGDTALTALAGPGSSLGTGGMVTKLEAAEKAARSGTITVIANGAVPDILLKIQKGQDLGTLLRPKDGRIVARKQWLAGQQKSKGRLILDQGAVSVLQKQGRSLLPIGVTHIEGQFSRGDMVLCVSSDGQEVARGLVNYGSDETQKIIGCVSSEIESRLGYIETEELIHRDNLVVF